MGIPQCPNQAHWEGKKLRPWSVCSSACLFLEPDHKVPWTSWTWLHIHLDLPHSSLTMSAHCLKHASYWFSLQNSNSPLEWCFKNAILQLGVHCSTAKNLRCLILLNKLCPIFALPNSSVETLPRLKIYIFHWKMVFVLYNQLICVVRISALSYVL